MTWRVKGVDFLVGVLAGLIVADVPLYCLTTTPRVKAYAPAPVIPAFCSCHFLIL